MSELVRESRCPAWCDPPASGVDHAGIVERAVDSWGVIDFDTGNVRSAWPFRDHVVLVLEGTWDFGGVWMASPAAVLVSDVTWDSFRATARRVLVEHEVCERELAVDAYPEVRIGVDVSFSDVVGEFHAVTNHELRDRLGESVLREYAVAQYEYYYEVQELGECEARERALYTVLGAGVREGDLFGEPCLRPVWWREYGLSWPDDAQRDG